MARQTPKEIDTYLKSLPQTRRERIETLLDAFRKACPNAPWSMQYRMPTCEGATTVSVGNQKHHICVYFCSREWIETIAARHPELSTGVGCVRIRDNQEMPVRDLVQAFRKAIG